MRSRRVLSLTSASLAAARPLADVGPAVTSRIQETMNNVLAIGETSGADALAGYLGVFKSVREGYS